MDRAGNLYGTTSRGGAGYGTVYEMKHSGSNWVFNPLYSSGGVGAFPEARVIFGPDGTLYGTTNGEPFGTNGTVFNLRPFPTVCKTSLCPWMGAVLYGFQGPPDGFGPGHGDLFFDRSGNNMYGTTINGGLAQYPCPAGCGTVFELSRSGGGWTESILYRFSGADGDYPYNGIIADKAGNLYSTTSGGGLHNAGAVFQLTCTVGCTETLPYNFSNGSDGSTPYAGLISDLSGNLYGAASDGGTGGGGTVFELTPQPDGSWTFTLLYGFTGTAGHTCGPWGTLVMDTQGNLYGTTLCDGPNNVGSVFKLTPSSPYWTYTSLHDFTGANDGANPIGQVVLDANGNIYGTAPAGGSEGAGVVWELIKN